MIGFAAFIFIVITAPIWIVIAIGIIEILFYMSIWTLIIGIIITIAIFVISALGIIVGTVTNGNAYLPPPEMMAKNTMDPMGLYVWIFIIATGTIFAIIYLTKKQYQLKKLNQQKQIYNRIQIKR